MSLLNGLLDQNVTAIHDVATPRPVKRPGAMPSVPAVTTKQEVKSLNPTGHAIETRLNQLSALGVSTGASFLPTSIEIPTSDATIGRLPVVPLREAKETSAHTPSAPLAVRCLDATSSASATLASEETPLQPLHEIAFALRLTWQPTGNVHALIPNPAPPVALQAQAGTRNPLSLGSPQYESAARSEGTSSESRAKAAAQAVLKPVSPSGGWQKSEPDPQGHSGFVSLPSRSSASTGALSVRETTEPSFSKISGEMRPDNVNPSPTRSNEGPSAEASDTLAEIASQPRMSRSALPSVTRAGSGSPPSEIAGRDTPIGNSELELKVPAPTASSKPEGEAPKETPERSPSSRTIFGRQATPPGDSGSVNDRETAPSASERKAPKIEIVEKSPQIQVSNPPADHAVAAGASSRSMVPGVVLLTQTKASVAPQQPATVSPELQIANPVQSQPIREISFRLGADSSPVDVQVAQRAGKIQVAVRTADPELAKSLQTNLGEVVGRLEDRGFRTETWTPVSGHGGPALREPNSNSQSGDSSSQNSQQDRQGQQESNQRQQRRWKAQLEDMFLAPSIPTYEGEQI